MNNGLLSLASTSANDVAGSTQDTQATAEETSRTSQRETVVEVNDHGEKLPSPTSITNSSSILAAPPLQEKGSDVPELQTHEISFFEISADRKYIATYSESDGLIVIYRIDGSRDSATLVPVRQQPDVISVTTHQSHHVLLSVSNEARYVCLSWLEGVPEEEWSPELSTCNIYRRPVLLNGSNLAPITIPFRRIRFQGTNLFLPNNKLALINSHTVQIYDEHLELEYTIDISNISAMTHTPIPRTKLFKLPIIPFSRPKYASIQKYSHYAVARDSANWEVRMNQDNMTYDFNFLKQCIRRGVILDFCWSDSLVRLWSVSDGQLIVALKTLCDRATVFAISHNGRFVVKYDARHHNLNIELFYVESGLLATTFKLSDRRMWGGPFYIDFVEHDRFLIFMTTVRSRNTERSESVVAYELWDIGTGKSIVCKETAHGVTFLPLQFVTTSEYVNFGILCEKQSIDPGGSALAFSPGSQKQRLHRLHFTRLQYYDHCSSPVDLDRTVIPINHRADPYYWLQTEFNDHNASSPGIWISYLTEAQDRVLRCGRYTVQVWTTAKDRDPDNEEGLVLDVLESIWCPPLRPWEEIESSEYNLDGLEQYHEIFWFSDESNDSENTYRPRILLDANGVDLKIKLDDDLSWVEEWIPTTESDDRHDFNIFKNACYALKFLKHVKNHAEKEQDKWETDHLDYLFKQVNAMVLRAIRKHPHFFETVSGSRALGDLIQASRDHHVLEILHNKNIRFKPCFYDTAKTETALTMAVANKRTKIVQYLVSYMIDHAARDEPGYMLVFTHCLPYLCEENPDLVLDWMRRICYIPATSRFPLIVEKSHMQPGKKVLTTKQELWAFAMQEQLPVARGVSGYLWQELWARASWPPWLSYPKRRHPKLGATRRRSNHGRKPHMAILCVFPLVGFTNYVEHMEDTKVYSGGVGSRKKARSIFAEEAMPGNSEVFKFGEPVMEALLMYKWRTFARARFFQIYTVLILYYLLFTFSIGFQELFTDIKITRTALTGLMFAISCCGLIQELRQMFGDRSDYFWSFYNYVDLAAYLLPAAAAIMQFSGEQFPGEASAITVLVLWVHAVQHLRVFKELGILIEIIVQIGRQVLAMVFLLVVIVCAFAHALLVLLSKLPKDAFVSQYTGVIESAAQPNVTEAILSLNSTADAGADKFRSFDIAFRTVWFFLNGDWGPLDIIANSWIINLLALMFSFTTAIVLLNVLIALMSDVVGGIKRKGKRVWVQYLAGYIAEIEVYWSSVSERENKRNQPTHVYYVAHTSTVDRWQHRLNRNRNDSQDSDENASNDEGDEK